MQKILIVEDDSSLNQAICYALEKENYIALTSHSIKEAKAFYRNNRVDLILLDLNLPDGEGFEFCKWVKNSQNNLPVIFLTARNLEEDALFGYEIGAEDYITKPFSLKILFKKIQLCLNRTEKDNLLRYNDGYLEISLDCAKIMVNHEECSITPTEFKLLLFFLSNQKQLLTYDVLLQKLWDGLSMDWMIIITVIAVIIALVMAVYAIKLKKEVYDFSDWLESMLNQIGEGKANTGRLVDERTNTDIEDLQDTLQGKFMEKVTRIDHIFQLKEKNAAYDKGMMKELISDISHQTKTPIASSKLYQELLQGEVTEQGENFLQKLVSQTDKLDFLLQSMVKMSRLESGIIHIQKQKENLYHTLRQAVSEIVPAATKKQLDIYVDCSEKFIMPHDRKWTVEAFLNVLDNAVKYTAAGGSIRITVIKQELFTKISFKDSGKGIALERQAEIFSRFYREPEVHNQSGIGIGTAFFLYLPNE